MIRAIWKGSLLLGKQRVPVRMYSVIEDRKIHFHLLHAKDHAPVEQHIVRKDDGEEVPKERQRKAFPLSRDSAVILEPEELQQLEPAASRDIVLCRLVPSTVLGDQWYDRPYALGPDADEEAYFALVSALDRQKVIGIATGKQHASSPSGRSRHERGHHERSQAGASAGPRAQRQPAPSEERLAGASKSDLYREAAKLHIPGRKQDGQERAAESDQARRMSARNGEPVPADPGISCSRSASSAS